MKPRKARELWDRLFNLKAGQVVRLTVATIFVKDDSSKYTLPRGTKGVIKSYIPDTPCISVRFTYKREIHNCYLDVKRVRRVDE